jgi:hypothetical protein
MLEFVTLDGFGERLSIIQMLHFSVKCEVLVYRFGSLYC